MKFAGEVYKIGKSKLKISKRFLVLNPFTGTLIRFANKDDFPLKALSFLLKTKILINKIIFKKKKIK